MADTLQHVSWFLEYACPFRQGGAVNRFVPAWNATAPLHAIDRAEPRGDVIDGVCVTGVSYSSREGRKLGSGFRVRDAVAPAGQLAAARATCRGCPTNAFMPDPGTMAGCSGWLSFHPDDPELDRALRASIARHSLAAAFDETFLQTKPLWYGLWAGATLPRRQLELLAAVMADVPGGKEEVTTFRRACETAVRHSILLHVNLPPPGHTDLGWDTTFPHCPRCRKHSGERWAKPYPTRPTPCRACGQVYVPAETASAVRDEYDPERDDLEHVLPPAEYVALRAEWERRHANDPPTWLENLMSGTVEVAPALMNEAAAAAGGVVAGAGMVRKVRRDRRPRQIRQQHEGDGSAGVGPGGRWREPAGRVPGVGKTTEGGSGRESVAPGVRTDPTTRFSDRVADYVAHRPRYPAAVYAYLCERLGVKAGTVVADLGAGTGIFCEPLLGMGCEVYGVEPNDAMRAAADRAMSRHSTAYHGVPGTAEDTGLAAGSVDVVVAAQAFHWFDPEKSAAECRRILRPGGRAALVWNTRRVQSTPFLRAYEELLNQFGTDYAAVRHDRAESARLTRFFASGYERASFPNAQRLDRAGLRGRLLSSSYTPAEGDPRRPPMLAALDRLFDLHQQGGTVTIDYETELYFGMP